MDKQNVETLLLLAEDLLRPWMVASTRPDELRMDAIVLPGNIKNAAGALKKAKWGYLSAITGLDHPGTAPVQTGEEKQWDRLSEDVAQPTYKDDSVIEVLYHFCNEAAVVTLRVNIPYKNPVIASICDLVPSATLYERELMEMFGVTCEDTPDSSRLLLPDDWEDGIYPLRKSFKQGETE